MAILIQNLVVAFSYTCFRSRVHFFAQTRTAFPTLRPLCSGFYLLGNRGMMTVVDSVFYDIDAGLGGVFYQVCIEGVDEGGGGGCPGRCDRPFLHDHGGFTIYTFVAGCHRYDRAEPDLYQRCVRRRLRRLRYKQVGARLPCTSLFPLTVLRVKYCVHTVFSPIFVLVFYSLIARTATTRCTKTSRWPTPKPTCKVGPNGLMSPRMQLAFTCVTSIGCLGTLPPFCTIV